MHPEPTPLLLKPLELPNLPHILEVGLEGINIGRDPGNRVVIPGDRYPQVSGQHARIEVREGELYLQDLGSKNGTFLNGSMVETTTLKEGDVVQLGSKGPRFRVVHRAAPVESTVRVVGDSSVSDSSVAGSGVPGSGLSSSSGRRMRSEEKEPDSRHIGDRTLLRMKRALGIPEDAEGVEGMLRAGSVRLILFGAAALIIALIGMTWAYYHGRAKQEEELGKLQTIIDRQQRQIEEHRGILEARELQLLRQLERMRREGQTSQEELRRLERELEETRGQLGAPPLDPKELAGQRRKLLEKIISAVVLIETEHTYWSRREEKYLFATREDDGGVRLNLSGEGMRYVRRDTGSGFCLSSRGWILTNRHVVAPDLSAEIQQLDLEPRVTIWATFNGQRKRHGGTVKLPENRDLDLALVKIDPFPKISAVSNFRLDVPMPPQTVEVYLLGFPYGTHTLQAGDDAVSASIFRGIVSRKVKGMIQVSAGVHPGNSGGPLVDDQGRVVGVITSVQALPDGSGLATNIGYAIPITEASALWPPDRGG